MPQDLTSEDGAGLELGEGGRRRRLFKRGFGGRGFGEDENDERSLSQKDGRDDLLRASDFFPELLDLHIDQQIADYEQQIDELEWSSVNFTTSQLETSQIDINININADDPARDDLVPVSIYSIQFLEVDPKFDVINQDSSYVRDIDFADGDAFDYESVGSDGGTTPGGMNMVLRGVNAAGQPVRNVFTITYTNDCDKAAFRRGESIGWVVFVSFIFKNCIRSLWFVVGRGGSRRERSMLLRMVGRPAGPKAFSSFANVAASAPARLEPARSLRMIVEHVRSPLFGRLASAGGTESLDGWFFRPSSTTRPSLPRTPAIFVLTARRVRSLDGRCVAPLSQTVDVGRFRLPATPDRRRRVALSCHRTPSALALADSCRDSGRGRRRLIGVPHECNGRRRRRCLVGMFLSSRSVGRLVTNVIAASASCHLLLPREGNRASRCISNGRSTVCLG